MSLSAFGWAWMQETGSATRKIVLLALADTHNSATGRCDPSVEYLRSKTELGSTAVKNALRELCEGEHAVITRTRKRRKDGALGTFAYHFPDDLQTRRGPRLEPRGVPDLEPPGVSQNQEVLNQEDPNQGLAPARAVAPVYDARKGTKIDGRNLPWDALVKATNSDERAESGRIARALKQIRSIVVETHSEQTFEQAETGEWFIAREIGARARLYRQRWPNVELTPTALAANWSRVATAQPGSDPMATMDAAQRGIDAARRTA